MKIPDIILPVGHPRSPYPSKEVTVHIYEETKNVAKGYLTFQMWWEHEDMSRHDLWMVDKKWSPFRFWRNPDHQYRQNSWTLRWWEGGCGDKDFKARSVQEAYEQVRSLIVKGWRLRRKGL